jgi:hypothetical protein
MVETPHWRMEGRNNEAPVEGEGAAIKVRVLRVGSQGYPALMEHMITMQVSLPTNQLFQTRLLHISTTICLRNKLIPLMLQIVL